MFLCEYMLQCAQQKKESTDIHVPILRRQIAGNWDNPFDMNYVDNLDIKLYVDDFYSHFGVDPPLEHIVDIAMFPTTENLINIQQYLKKRDMNLSKL